MTNKPMLSVERELLEDALALAIMNKNVKVWDRLRTILKDPANNLCPVCNGFGRYQDGDSGTDEDGRCPNVVNCDCDDNERMPEYRNIHPDDLAVDSFALSMKAKLAKSRDKGRGGWESCSGEDLSKMLRDHVDKGDPVDVANFCMFLSTMGLGIEMGCEEQPAPVADHTQCEECKGWGYHENHHEGGGTECGECDGSGNATVAVVMPERMDPRDPYDSEANQWNACLDEVARLNGVKQ